MSFNTQSNLLAAVLVGMMCERDVKDQQRGMKDKVGENNGTNTFTVKSARNPQETLRGH